jgi:hypothetical protein
MGQAVQVVIPTYRRPDSLLRVLDELWGTPGAIPVVVRHTADPATHHALSQVGVAGSLAVVLDTTVEPSGVTATNLGFAVTTTEWVVVGQDDIRYHPGWLAAALDCANRTGAEVIGLNDLLRPPETEWSVTWLVHRPYAVQHGLSVGYPGMVFHPGYRKNYADNELNETAKHRRVWAYAADAVTEHLHPTVRKSPSDRTYTDNERWHDADRALYRARKHLWS